MTAIIKSISVVNFVTYTSVEFRPQRNLNVIIGPNGTGKSSLLSAIVLGLGGKPKVVARGANVASYVKEGCKSASIEIELENPDGQNYIIKRTIDLNNKTTWSVNGRTKTPKDIEALMKELHIQVDNLCQFLPQDRVQDFAKMDEQCLLENTEKSVGSQEMYDQHMQLNQLRSEQIEMERSIDTVKTTAENEQQLNDGHAVQIKKLQEKKQLTTKIAQLRKKRGWVLFKERKEEKAQVIADKALAAAEQARCESLCRPLDRKLDSLKKKLTELEKNVTTLRHNASRRQTTLRDRQTKLDQLDDSVDELTAQLRSEEDAEAGRAAEIDKFTQIINRLQNDLDSCIERPDEEVRAEILALQPEIRRCSELVQALQTRYNAVRAEAEGLSHEIVAKEAEKRRVENMLNNRLNMLRQSHPDVHKAVMWLRENQQRFVRKVYEPLVLEIDVVDPHYAKYVENAINNRDLMAFVCEDKDDMAKLVKELRSEQDLGGINVLFTDPSQNLAYRSKHTIQELRRYGFQSYLREQVTAPKAIMDILCKYSAFHSIPVGDDTVNTDRVPKDVRQFYAGKYNYSNSYSKYTNELSTRTMEVNEAHYFASVGDSGALAALTESIAKLNKKKGLKQQQIREIQTQLEREEGEINGFRTRKRKLQEELEAKRTIEAQLNTRLQRRQRLEDDRINLEALRATYLETCKQKVRKMMVAQNFVLEATKELQGALAEVEVGDEECTLLKQRRIGLDNASRDLKTKKKNAEEMVLNLERRIVTIKQEVNTVRAAALELTDGLGPWQEDFKKRFNDFGDMPDSLQDLDDEIADMQGRVDCLGGDNNPLLAEYEERLRRIASLTHDMETRGARAAAKQAEMDALRAVWLPAVEGLIERINFNFGRSFRGLGCAGEVALMQGENPNDFGKYGIRILVQYREKEKLQQLNQYLQSGGERAVATAVYLISLQELTSSPFRCVDEINQGMDPINERQIFDLLVNTTSRPDTAQYFLLTPKLLPSLGYEDTVSVTAVLNGMRCAKSNWEFDKYMNFLHCQN